MHITHFDISNKRDLLKIAEEVRESNTIRILNRKSESIAVVVPIEIYEQWEKEGEELLSIMNIGAATANLSPKEADQIADEAVHAIRAA